MKRYGKRCAALALALTVALLCALPQPALASWALGEELMERTVELAHGAALTEQSLWSASKSDLRTEHYITYTPGGKVKPVVFSGIYVASTNTVAAAAARMEEQGWRVAAAVNGSFFNSDGTIVGILMTDGVVRALDVCNYAMLGFTGDGQVFIDESDPVLTAAWTALEPAAEPETDPGTQPDPETDPGTQPDPAAEPETDPGTQRSPELTAVPRTFRVAGFNAYRNADFIGGLYLYNKDFASRVTSLGTCVSAILRPVGQDGMKMNGAMTFEVVSVTDTNLEGVAFDGVIPEGCYMLYGEDHDNAELLDALRGLVPGGTVSLTLTGVDERWKDAAYGISGLHALLRDGEIVDGLPAAANPQTAVGIKQDGSAVFYTIDGRQSGYSVGASYAQVAERLQELGCVSAVALDGGGSTTLGAALPGSEGFAVVNWPSTAGRRINNTILLVVPAEERIVAPGAYVSARRQVVLAGAELAVSAAAYDELGNPTGQQDLDWTALGGTVAADGASAVYTAGTEPGIYSVSAGSADGAMPVRVVDRLSRLTVTRAGESAQVSSLTLEPGEQVELAASGAWWNLPVAMDNGDVAWNADEAVGTIDENGCFTAGAENGEGTITASAGGRTVTIPVKVERIVPFADIADHWSRDYVIRLHELGLTSGKTQEDGTVLYGPNDPLTRAELLAFVTRVLGVDESYYYTVEMPFADNTAIPNWAQNYIQAMYTLGVLRGAETDGELYANVDDYVTREEAMTILGRVLSASQGCDLSRFPDAGEVSDWASPQVQTLVALNVVEGGGGLLSPKAGIDRASIAKLLVEVYPLEKALLIPRLDLMS